MKTIKVTPNFIWQHGILDKDFTLIDNKANCEAFLINTVWFLAWVCPKRGMDTMDNSVTELTPFSLSPYIYLGVTDFQFFNLCLLKSILPSSFFPNSLFALASYITACLTRWFTLKQNSFKNVLKNPLHVTMIHSMAFPLKPTV